MSDTTAVIVLILGILALWIGLRRLRKGKPKSTPQNIPQTTPRETDGEWTTFRANTIRQHLNMVILPKTRDVPIKRVHTDKSVWRRLFQLAVNQPVELSLEREPSNKHDANAIRVHARLTKAGKPELLGYLPRDIAARITNDYHPDMPIGAELARYGYRNEDPDKMFIFVNPLVPPAKERREYEW